MRKIKIRRHLNLRFFGKVEHTYAKALTRQIVGLGPVSISWWKGIEP